MTRAVGEGWKTPDVGAPALVGPVHALASGLRRAEHVHDPQVGDELQQLRLHRRRKDRAAGQEEPEVLQSAGTDLELVDEGASERVADDQQRGDALVLDRVEEVDRVEPDGIGLDDHRATGDPRADGVPVRRAVHERRGGEGPEVGAAGCRHQVLGGARHPEARREEVGLSPEDALGHARGSARVEDVEVVGRETDRGGGGGGGQGGLVGHGAGEQRRTGAVLHLEQQLHVRERGEHRGEGGGEGPVVDDGPRPGSRPGRTAAPRPRTGS